MLLKSKTKTLALSAMLTALSVLLLYLAAVLPSAQLAVTAVASLLPAAAVIRCGYAWSAGVYAATAVLLLLLLPQKGPALAYALIVGHYPILKSLIERLDKLVLEWILKLALFYGLLCVYYFGFSKFFLELVTVPEGLLVWFFLGGGVVFVLYDIGFSKLIGLFSDRIGKYIK